MTDAILKFLKVVEKLIDAAPKAIDHIKALKDEARKALESEPELANKPEVQKAVTDVIDKAAEATPVAQAVTENKKPA